MRGLKWEDVVGYVICGRGGELITRGHPVPQLGGAAESILGRGAPVHSFRHGFAVHAVHSKVPDKMPQVTLEHGSLSTTGRYLKRPIGNVKALRESLEGMEGPGSAVARTGLYLPCPAALMVYLGWSTISAGADLGGGRKTPFRTGSSDRPEPTHRRTQPRDPRPSSQAGKTVTRVEVKLAV